MSNYFSEALERYLMVSRNKKGNLIGYSTSASFGDILEIAMEEDFIIGTYIDNERALLMSEFYELAGPKDIIVEFEHILGYVWLIETDRPIDLSRAFGFRAIGILSEEDKSLLKSVLDGNPIPRNKRGLNVPYNNPTYPQNVFKAQEKKRLGSLFTNLG